MVYVDGFVLAVKKNKLKDYKKMAVQGGKVWMKHGALQYMECIGDDLNVKGVLPFPKMVKPKPGETIAFSWIVFKSKAHRKAVNKKVMNDPSMQPENFKDKEMPFDMKRMAYGGFKALVSRSR